MNVELVCPYCVVRHLYTGDFARAALRREYEVCVLCCERAENGGGKKGDLM
jgi:hypothetical protein